MSKVIGGVIAWVVLAILLKDGIDPIVIDWVRVPECVGELLTPDERNRYSGTWEGKDADDPNSQTVTLQVEIDENSRGTATFSRSGEEPKPVKIELRRIGDLIVCFAQDDVDPKSPDKQLMFTPVRVEFVDQSVLKVFFVRSRPFKRAIEEGRLTGRMTLDESGENAAIEVTSTLDGLKQVMTEDFLKDAYSDEWVMEYRRPASSPSPPP